MKYRPEIDGLRAVAVLPVIAFHAGFETFSGGFVGVDVFFVISGYLITTILLDDLQGGRFSLMNFYDRRARRILPALFTVIAVSIPFAWMWMTPLAFKDFGQSIAAVVLFASNFLFWWETDYFAAAAELKPLLHTWSLAIEEQFYLFFPLLLAFFWKAGTRRILGLIVILALVSLASGEWAWRNAPAANFYLPMSRVWELFAGSICAVVLRSAPPRPQGLLAAAGLGAILVAIFAFDGSTPFPSLYALLPVGGTALIIVFSSGTAVARLLSWRVLVGIGLISYSAYLWHQPLFAFARIRSVHEPSLLLMTGLGLLALVLAWATWAFVESPFRGRAGAARFSRGQIFSIAGAVAAVFLAFGVLLDRGEGLGWRQAPSGVAYADYDFDHVLRFNYGLSDKCIDMFVKNENCYTSETPDTLVWGDSFAMHITPALLASDPYLSMVQQTMGECMPIKDISITKAKLTFSWGKRCIEFNDKVLEWLSTQSSIEYVVISSPLKVFSYDMMSAQGVINGESKEDLVIKKMKETADLITAMGKRPVFISPTPKIGKNIGECLRTAGFLGATEEICDFKVSQYSDQTISVYDMVDKISDVMPVIRLEDYLCPNEICDMVINGVFIYRDHEHLTVEGSALLGRQIGLVDLVKSRADLFYQKENTRINDD